MRFLGRAWDQVKIVWAALRVLGLVTVWKERAVLATYLRSRSGNSAKFEHFAKTFTPILPMLPLGKIQFLWQLATQKVWALNRQVMEIRPHCWIEAGIIYTERYPNAVCTKIAPDHYIIGCFSSLISALSIATAYLVNRKESLLTDKFDYRDVVQEEDVSHLWGFEFLYGKEDRAIDEVNRVQGSLLYEFIFLSGLEFILHHELAHIVLGHLDYFEQRAAHTLYSEIDSKGGTGTLDKERVYCELTADRYAANALVVELLTDHAPQSLRDSLRAQGILGVEAPFELKIVSQMLALWVLSIVSVTDILKKDAKLGLTAFKTWTSYPSSYFRLLYYKKFVLEASRSEMHYRTVMVSSIWGNAEKILARMAALNPSFAPLIMGLDPIHSDQTVLPEGIFDEFEDEIKSFIWINPRDR